MTVSEIHADFFAIFLFVGRIKLSKVSSIEISIDLKVSKVIFDPNERQSSRVESNESELDDEWANEQMAD